LRDLFTDALMRVGDDNVRPRPRPIHTLVHASSLRSLFSLPICACATRLAETETIKLVESKSSSMDFCVFFSKTQATKRSVG